MANKYDIVNGLSDLKFHDWAINSLAATAAMSRGRWVMQNANQEAVQSNASPILLPHTVYRPVWSGQESPDSQETELVTTVYGPHEVIVDEYVADPTIAGRPAWAMNLPIVAVSGELTTYLAGTDNEEAILGHVVIPPASGEMRVHIRG